MVAQENVRSEGFKYLKGGEVKNEIKLCTLDQHLVRIKSMSIFLVQIGFINTAMAFEYYPVLAFVFTSPRGLAGFNFRSPF